MAKFTSCKGYKEGAQWKVGDGQSIRVFAHRWLSHKPIFLGDQQHNLMEKDLIDVHTFQWDKEKIHDLFAHRTCMEILSIPLQSNLTQDVLVWKENCKVEFNQPSYWLYSMPNLLIFQHLVTLYLGGFVVRVMSEIEC